MKILKKIIVLLLLSLVIISCSSNDDSANTNKPTYLLTKASTASGGGTYLYNYDDRNRLISYNYSTLTNTSTTTTFTYNSKEQIESSVTTAGSDGITRKTMIVYDDQERIIEKKYLQNSIANPAIFGITSSYVYMYKNNTITVTYNDIANSAYKFQTIYEYDTNGNVIKTTTYNKFSVDNPTGTINTYEIDEVYDTAINPYSLLPQAVNFPVTKNNLTTATSVNGTSGTGFSIKITYKYNEDGLVTERVQDGRPKITFEYKKI